MSIRENEIRSRRFEVDEMRRKIRDLAELKAQLESSLDRLSDAGAGGRARGSSDERRETLMRSLREIEREIRQTRDALNVSREQIEREESVHNGYDRIPVAIGSRRGRGQVEHIRIVRNQRS